MKLTNHIREAFVRAAMADVPEVDYQEAIQKAAMAAVLEALPPSIRKAWDDKDMRPYIRTAYRHFGDVTVAELPGYGGSRYGGNDSASPVISAKNAKSIEALAAKKTTQEETRAELQRKLKGAAFACSTRKGLAELLPEFEKYLPADEPAAIRTLPVVANIVADFAKAGWPKGKKSSSLRAA